MEVKSIVSEISKEGKKIKEQALINMEKLKSEKEVLEANSLHEAITAITASSSVQPSSDDKRIVEEPVQVCLDDIREVLRVFKIHWLTYRLWWWSMIKRKRCK